MQNAIGEYLIVDGVLIKRSEHLPPSQGSKEFYDVLRTEEGIPLFLDAHLNRLTNSIELSGYKNIIIKSNISQLIRNLIIINKLPNNNIRISFDIYDNNTTHLCLYHVKSNYPTFMAYTNGVSCTFQYAERQNPNAKIYNPTLRDKANHLIEENHIFETILVDHNNCITEGSRSNLFLTKKNTLYTSPDDIVLKGVIREQVIKLANRRGLKIIFTTIKKDTLQSFDSAFLTGTSPRILPIRSIDNILFDTKNNLIQLLISDLDTLIQTQIKHSI